MRRRFDPVADRGFRVAAFVGHQLAWWACVLAARAGRPAFGVPVMAAFVAVHLSLVRRPGAHVRLALLAAGLGYALDSGLVLGGCMAFPVHTRLAGPSPLWMVALWLGFGATLPSAFPALAVRPLLGALLGGIAGPLAYAGGTGLGVLQIAPGLASYLAIGCGWAIAVGLLLRAAQACMPSRAGPGLREGEGAIRAGVRG